MANKNPKHRYHQFPRKLTEENARWIKAVLKLDLKQRRAAGFKRHTNGLYQRLANHFNVSVWCIESIDRKRRWRAVKPKDWSNRSTT